ncbi:aspartyl-phosphate phosphatase Spo0E family protein [Bacillus sp. REN10]|uniref:aspartyl-phosphate phosphatase Spo0E family protein n=1 Tax=Bacillus sp. REN10 TaxID=2782541 RepID=UPI00193BAB8F|nr:aspartyl-phosphate phosphatase Spo0E family protein [Bacillus sp. REN10]
MEKIDSNLVTEIMSKRHLMIKTGMMKGLSHSETIKYSQELDKLIAKYQMISRSFQSFND